MIDLFIDIIYLSHCDVLYVRSETVAVRRRMNMVSNDYEGQIIPGDECRPNFLACGLQSRKNPGKPSIRDRNQARCTRGIDVTTRPRRWLFIIYSRISVNLEQRHIRVTRQGSDLVVYLSSRFHTCTSSLSSKHCNVAPYRILICQQNSIFFLIISARENPFETFMSV